MWHSFYHFLPISHSLPCTKTTVLAHGIPFPHTNGKICLFLIYIMKTTIYKKKNVLLLAVNKKRFTFAVWL